MYLKNKTTRIGTRKCKILDVTVSVGELLGTDGKYAVVRCNDKTAVCTGTGCPFAELGGEVWPFEESK